MRDGSQEFYADDDGKKAPHNEVDSLKCESWRATGWRGMYSVGRADYKGTDWSWSPPVVLIMV